MSPPKNPKDPNKKSVEPAQESTTARPQAERDPAPPKVDYEFKIVRADPKNDFDFEDVADK